MDQFILSMVDRAMMDHRIAINVFHEIRSGKWTFRAIEQ